MHWVNHRFLVKTKLPGAAGYEVHESSLTEIASRKTKNGADAKHQLCRAAVFVDLRH